MLRSIVLYFGFEIAPRIRKIAFSSQLVAALIIGGTVGVFGSEIPFGRVTYGDLAAGLLTYGVVSFGFAVAALSLVLAIPHGRFSEWLASQSVESASPYPDLLFVFSWTAVLHWLFIVLLLTLILFNGTSADMFPIGENSGHQIGAGLLTFLTAYSLLQFLVALITLSQFGRIYILFLQSGRGAD